MQVPAFVFIIMAGAWSDKYGNIQRKCKLILMLLKQHCCRQADHNIPFNTGHAAIKCLCHVQRNILRGNVSGLVAFHFNFWAHWRHQRILCWDVCLCCRCIISSSSISSIKLIFFCVSCEQNDKASFERFHLQHRKHCGFRYITRTFYDLDFALFIFSLVYA